MNTRNVPLHISHDLRYLTMFSLSSLLLLLLLPAAVLSGYCYPQYCYESNGYDYVSCDQEYNTCVPGTWLTYASCLYTGWADSTGVIWCEDNQSCNHDWNDGYPFCYDNPVTEINWSSWSDIGNEWSWYDSDTDWSEVQEDWDTAVKAGLGIFYTIIIVIVVIIVVSILLCILCCYCCGKGCCGKKRASGQNVVIQNTVQPTEGGVPPQHAPAAYPHAAHYGAGGVYFNQGAGDVSVGQPYPPAPPQPPTQHPVPISYNQQPPAYSTKQ